MQNTQANWVLVFDRCGVFGVQYDEANTHKKSQHSRLPVLMQVICRHDGA